MKDLISLTHHIGLPTRDLPGTVEFYKNLGGEIIFETEVLEEGVPVKVIHMLLANIIFEIYERSETEGRSGAFDHFAFGTTDIEAVFNKAQSLKMEFLFENIQGSSYWPGAVKWFMVIGPNGEKVEFIQV